MVRYACNNQERRAFLRDPAENPKGLNGIDFLEVSADQKTLSVHFINSPPPAGVNEWEVRIEGGVRVNEIRVVSRTLTDDVLQVGVAEPGDFTSYVLHLVEPPRQPGDKILLDPRLSEVEFSFKVECPSEFDCKPAVRCAPEVPDEPEISYLAKDYGSFRRLMLDRLSAITPDWRERNPADVGIALVEILAYVGDQLSYFQDAAATEAYLGTARKRASVRRHARLVDYFLHEGTNARSWVLFEVKTAAEGKTLPAGTPVLTRRSPESAVLPPDELAAAAFAGEVIFETLEAVSLHVQNNEIAFYTWSDRECCLPAGATAATLEGPLPDLAPGDLLLFEEVLGPQTGVAADADPRHRHVVRLTQVEGSTSKHPLTDPLNGQAVVEIAWDPADALPFPLCISAVTDDRHGSKFYDRVSVARGNLVLADHGFTVVDEPLGEVPEDRPFRPVLDRGPLTQAVPWSVGATGPASLVAVYGPEEAAPAVYLTAGNQRWDPRRDLLASGKFDRAFVAEVEEDGRAHLRFGDDENGKAPAVKTAFTATYRVGNGTAGNVGADVLCQVALSPAGPVPADGIEKVRNPLSAWGGVERESLEQARQYAPQAFRRQNRAVTEADYAEVAERHPEVQRAAATFRWTGSWYTVFLTVDRVGGQKVDAAFEARLRAHLERFRMAGYDLEVDGPRPVALELRLEVCVEPDHFRSQVKAALLERFSNRVLPDGSRGFFHPDDWTFGQPVYLSRIYAAASEVEGVESVKVMSFKRSGRPQQREIEDGVLPIGRLEIAVLDNDPSFQENGRLLISMGGGK